ncbi:MAG: hypothetical protein P8X69_04570 [Maritimibacter sp.]
MWQAKPCRACRYSGGASPPCPIPRASGKPGKRVAVLRNGSGAVEVAREGDLSSAGIVTEIGASDMRIWRMGEEISFTLPEAHDRPTQPL